jgi:predicted ribosome quality control (RQC) complex YloA/Tae2 family protein
MTLEEVQRVCEDLRPVLGGTVQAVSTSSEADLVLELRGGDQVVRWVWVDMKPSSLSLLSWERLPLRFKRKKTPIGLFLEAHFEGRRLVGVEVLEDLGRALRLVFRPDGEGKDTHLDVILFPQARNVIASAQGKSISWFKPKEMKAVAARTTHPHVVRLPRDVDGMRSEWLLSRDKSWITKKETPSAKSAKVEDVQSVRIQKLHSAAAKVQQELDRRKELPWRAVGDALKASQSLLVPDAWAPFVDRTRSLSWNVQRAYAEARDNENKMEGGQARLETLRKEIESQAKSGAPLSPQEPIAQKTAKISGIAGTRSLQLSPTLRALMGRSAKANLELLRQARAWDLWMHIKDEPGAHIVVFRERKARIIEATLHEVALWALRQQLGARFEGEKGALWSFVWTECRHVRPIKGDRLGRVSFHEGKELRVRVPRT